MSATSEQFERLRQCQHALLNVARLIERATDLRVAVLLDWEQLIRHVNEALSAGAEAARASGYSEATR